MSWPPKSEQSTALKKELNTHPSWLIYNVIILKYYDTLLAARQARNGYIVSSNYETDDEFGRGKCKKMKNHFLCDESFSTKKKNLKKRKNLKIFHLLIIQMLMKMMLFRKLNLKKVLLLHH